MMLKPIFISVLCACVLSACTAELREINQKVGVWAGKMIEIRDGTSRSEEQVSEHSVQSPLDFHRNTSNSKKNIDSLFVKLKRELQLRNDEIVPSVYYKIGGTQSDPHYFPKLFSTVITLEKEDGKVTVRWELYGTPEYVKSVERKILKIIK